LMLLFVSYPPAKRLSRNLYSLGSLTSFLRDIKTHHHE
jgi:hypothetical protein